MVRKADFDAAVPLPPQLGIGEIARAIDYIEKQLADLVDVYYEQANVFSALVGIFGVKALDSVSAYEKHRHTDTAQQRFPDLRLKGSGDNPTPNESLESKASKRPWSLQSHYDHPGWYIVWRYLVDITQSLEPARPVVIWRIDVAYLKSSDWKYESSTAGSEGGGRTHTFGVIRPATKLKDKAVYKRSDVVIRRGKPVPANGRP
ncbi:MAG: hypothetical protein ABFS30_11635 [Pseudomonadota bacterium]